MRIKQTKIWGFFSSIRLAIWLLSTIAFFSLIGTFIPQSTIYSSWWFILLLVLFSLNLIVCILNRFALKNRSWGSFVSHLSILIILCGALIGILFGQKDLLKISKGQEVSSFMSRGKKVNLGFSLRLNEFIYNENIDAKERLLVYRNTKAEKGVCDVHNKPLATKESEGFLAEVPINPGIEQDIGNTGYQIKVLRYLPDFVMDTSTKQVLSRSASPNNPALQVELKDSRGGVKTAWLFARFPDIHQEVSADFRIFYHWAPRRPKDFISKVTILKDGKEILSRDIQVNAPLNFAGYNFFQTSYDSQDLSWTGLQVVKDPGVPVIYAGFVLLIVGLVMIFYVGPLFKGDN